MGDGYDVPMQEYGAPDGNDSMSRWPQTESFQMDLESSDDEQDNASTSASLRSDDEVMEMLRSPEGRIKGSKRTGPSQSQHTNGSFVKHKRKRNSTSDVSDNEDVSDTSTGCSEPERELGGSISRAARMRAASTEDDGIRSSSSSSSSSSDYDEPDKSTYTKEQPAHSAFRNGKSGKSFVTASRGEAYLHAMSRPAKNSNKKLSDTFTIHKPFTQKSLLAALSKADSASGSTTGGMASHTQQQLQDIENAYRNFFQQWSFELAEGFSVLLYGLGSKIRVLEAFGKHLVQKERRKHNQAHRRGKVIIIRGFMAALSLDQLLRSLEEALLPAGMLDEAARQGKSAAKLDQRLSSLLSYLTSRACPWTTDRPIWLIVHNIDGVALRPFRAQNILSSLAACPAVRVLASFDHVKAPILMTTFTARSRSRFGTPPLDQQDDSGAVHLSDDESPRQTQTKRHRGFNAIYHHIPTWQPYTVESLLSGALASVVPPAVFMSDAHITASAMNGAGRGSSEDRAKAAYFVLASLPQKSKRVFRTLAERQMALMSTASSAASNGVDVERTPTYATSYATLFAIARDELFLGNVIQLEALLREFRDHHVVLSSLNRPEGNVEDGDGVSDRDRAEAGQRAGEWLWIPIDKEDLEELLERLQT
ncbi:Origin recognition complex subunit 2 [Cystobasidiomycetes sp. EMM_F5]